jgi:hypothetical protein
MWYPTQLVALNGWFERPCVPTLELHTSTRDSQMDASLGKTWCALIGWVMHKSEMSHIDFVLFA